MPSSKSVKRLARAAQKKHGVIYSIALAWVREWKTDEEMAKLAKALPEHHRWPRKQKV